MKHKAAIKVFLACSLALVLAVPAVNLSKVSARAHAQRLISQKKTDLLVQLLFNSDVLMARFSALTWRTGLSNSPTNVVVGQEGWMFLGDGHENNTSAQRFGESVKDARLARDMGQNLLAWNRWLRAQGVKAFAVVIGADKHRIYNDHLPDWANLQRTARSRALLDGPARPLIADPAPALRQLSGDDAPHTYYRSDTHWNMWGAAISMETLRQTLTQQGLSLNWALTSPPTIDHTGTRIGGDLASFLRIQATLTEQEPHPALLNRDAIKSDVRELDTGNPLKAGDFGRLQYPGHTVQVVTEGAANDLKVLWLRDSFGIAQSPLMAANFRETIQLHWGRALDEQARLFVDLVRQQKPDVVVITVVERVLPANLFLVPPPQE